LKNSFFSLKKTTVSIIEVVSFRRITTMAATGPMPWEVVKSEGNETMKRLMSEGFDSPKRATIVYWERQRVGAFKTPEEQVLFYWCFRYPAFVSRNTYQYTPEEILAIAAVYLFFMQSKFFKPHVKLMELHDAITNDFRIEVEKEKTGEKLEFSNLSGLGKIEQASNFSVLLDISDYFALYKEALGKTSSTD